MTRVLDGFSDHSHQVRLPVNIPQYLYWTAKLSHQIIKPKMYIPSPPVTQRHWILGEATKDDDIRLPLSPRTPEALYVFEQTEKFGRFLSLSDHARSRALQHRKKQLDADSTRLQRRRSIFDAVKTLLLESNDDELHCDAGCSGVESPAEVRGKIDVKNDMTPRLRYKRRGSCTKFSLEAELMSHEDLSEDDQAQFKFKSFRRNETLQNDEVFGESDAEDEQGSYHPHRSMIPPPNPLHKNSLLTTIDQMPLPMKRSVPTFSRSSDSPLHVRSFSLQSSPTRDEERALPIADWSPLSCATDPGSFSIVMKKNEKTKPQHRPKMPKLRDVSTHSSHKHNRSSGANQSSQKCERYPPSQHPSDHTNRKIKQNLPKAPFDQSSRGGNSVDHVSLEHQRTDVESKNKSRESTPSLGSLMKRINLQRHDSIKSLAEQSRNDDGSLTVDTTQQESGRVGRRASMSTKTSTPPVIQKLSTCRGYSIKGSQYGDNNESHHNHISSRRPSAASRSVASESHSVSHVRNSWHHLKRRESFGDSGADPVKPKNVSPPDRLVSLPPLPPLLSTTTVLPRFDKIPRHPTGGRHCRDKPRPFVRSKLVDK
jgi:hypothetical protein